MAARKLLTSHKCVVQMEGTRMTRERPEAMGYGALTKIALTLLFEH